MSKKITLVIILVFIFQSLNIVSQTVSISDQNGNNNINSIAPQIKIDCDYNFVAPKKVRLTATFPDIKNPTEYTVAPITFAPIGLFSTGTPISIIADDVWSKNIPIGFSFCFYGNNYSTLDLADNGIVRFGYNSTVEEEVSTSITNKLPSPSLIKNAIFACFQDYLLAPVNFGCIIGDNCGSISYETTGVIPFRRMIINYNLVNHLGCSNSLSPINTIKSTFQVVLYETTNIIEIYVKDKPLTCIQNASGNSGIANSLIGLNKIDGSVGGIAPIDRNTDVWAATDEAYRFTPNGSSTTLVSWFDNLGNPLLNINPIEVIPTVNTYYTVKVKYNICTPIEIQSQINVAFDLNYPVAPNITKNICDVAAPFPNQTGIDVEALLIDVSDIAGTSKTIFTTQEEANVGSQLATPLTGMNNYTMTETTKVFYYREQVGICYVTGKITLNLFQTPTIADQNLDICDAGNDGTEIVNLSTLTSQIVGFNSSTMGIGYYQNSGNANLGGLNTITSVTVNKPPGFFDVFIRVYNLLNPTCFSVSKLKITILPNLVSGTIATFCIPDPNFDGIVNYDLTRIAVTNLNIPAVIPNYTYHTSLSNAQNNIPIPIPTAYNFAIPPAPLFTTIYVKANLPGYCPTIQPVQITICVPSGNDDNGGNGGFGGAGFAACLNAGDQIPSFNLEALFNVVILPVAPIPTPTGYYRTLRGAQTQDALVQLTVFEVANFKPTPLFSEIWVRYVDINGIVGIKKLVIPVKFKSNQIINKELCDVYNDLKETINLSPTSPYIKEIQALNLGETITCYPTQLDYDNNTSPIVGPNFNFTLDFNANSIKDTVYIRVSSYGCDSDYKLVFKLNKFLVEPPIDQKVCDTVPLGSEPFPNLQTLVNGIIPKYSATSTFSLHSSLDGAYDNSAIITNLVNYNVTPTTSVYIRIAENPVLFPLACPTIQEIKFNFSGSILVNSVAALLVCDTDNDDKVVISNLNAYVASIISTLNTDAIIAKLYTDKDGAIENNFAFEIRPNWDDYEYNLNAFTPFSPNNSIWLYLQNTITGCSRVVEIKLQMQSVVLPVLNNPLKICDFENDNKETIADFNYFNPQVVPSSFLYNFQYFLSEAEAVAGTPVIPANYLLSNNQTIWIKITTSTNTTCSKIKDYVVSFTKSPIVSNIEPKICDNLSDNLESKNLNAYQADIIAEPSNYTFDYYLSLENAVSDSNKQPVIYDMTFASDNFAKPIFVKVINNLTKCYSIATIKFERKPLIDAFDEKIFTCDISIGGTLKGLFNLISIIPRIGNVGMVVNPLNYDITYHTDKEATVANIIPNPSAFTVLANQTSYAYVKFVDKITGCFTIKKIELQIYLLPKFFDGEVFICDDDLNGAFFQNLTQLNGVVVLPDPLNPNQILFEYFNSFNDAFNGLEEITTNINNFPILLNQFPKSIFVKGTNANNCSKIREVILRKKPNIPLISNEVKLLKCDSNNNGIEDFNLKDAEELITNQVGVTFKYYEKFEDAQANNANFIPIASLNTYSNLINNQIIYVRLSKPATNCDSWAKISLKAFHESYNFPAQEILCDNNNDGSETVNLQEIVLGYIAPLTLSKVNLKFYNNPDDANSGTTTGLIPNSIIYTFTNFSTDIYVRLTNIATGCAIVKKINFLNPPPIVLIDVQKEVCDLDRNNQETINLSDYFQSMSVPLVSNFTISSYSTSKAANTGLDADISNTNYLQIIPNQVYWIRFQDKSGCYSVKSITVRIIKLANPISLQRPIIECDNGTTLLNSEEFNLLTNFPFGITNPNDFNFTYHTSLSDAQNNTGLIPVDQHGGYASGSATIGIRIVSKVSNSLPNCAVYVKQTLLIVPLATPVILQNPILECDNDSPLLNSEEFNLLTNYPFGVTNPNDFNFTYHTSLANAQNNDGLIPIDQQGSYASGSTTIGIRIISKVSNTLPNCAVYLEQPIILVPLATPKNNPKTIAICDVNLSGDLKEIFNLATNEDFIRNGNTTDLYSYFPTKPDAENNVTANQIINFGEYFTGNTSVWIRIVTNAITTLQKCAIIVEQKLQVNPLPFAGPITDLYSCINSGTTTATFNLNDRVVEALSGQDSTEFSVTFHLIEDDAKAGLYELPFNYLSNSKTIYASVKNNLTGCRNTAKLELITETATTATRPAISSITFCDNDNINDGITFFNPKVLDQEILGVNQFGVLGYEVKYYASENDFNINLEISNVNGFYPANNALVIANVTNNLSKVIPKCSAKTSFNLKIIKLPETNPKDGFICKDQTTGELLSAYTIDSELSNDSHTFEWFLNSSATPISDETSSTLTVKDAGEFSVVATQIAYPNCKSLPKKIKVTKSEPAIATARVEYSFTDNLNILTIATGIGNYVYQLDENEIQTSNLFENVGAGTHQIAVIDKNGCATFYLSVIVLDYVRFFTPNADGFGDKWNIKGIQDQPDAKVFIFDRYGKLLKQVVPGEEGWDGTYAGNSMPSDDYWFTVTYEENGEKKEFKSHFAMKR